MSKRKKIAAGAAVLGGAAFAVWFLSRGGRGWGLSGGGSRKGGGAPCRVRVDRSDLKLQGKTIDISQAVAACKEAGRAEVSASGAAVVSVVLELIQKLRAAGIDVRTDPEIWQLAGLRPEDWLE
jgi:hypothetical protein